VVTVRHVVAMERIRAILLAVLVPVLLGAAAAGQEPLATAADAPPQPAATRPEAGLPEVRELSPELYYLKDESGRLVPVPGFGYRDFLELFRIKEGLGGPALPPPAILESVVVRIDARGSMLAPRRFRPIGRPPTTRPQLAGRTRPRAPSQRRSGCASPAAAG
jgi:hypothetical protein